MFSLDQLKKVIPVTHLAAAAICVLVTGITVTLLPDSNASTERTQIALSISTETDAAAQAPSAINTPDTSDSAAQVQASSTTPSVADDTPPIPEDWQEYKISNGDNLTTIFKKAGLTAKDVYSVSQAISGTNALKRLYPGQMIGFVIEDNQLIKLRHIQSKLESAIVERNDSGYSVKEIARTPELMPRFAEGTIENSLFYDASQAGLSNRMIMELAALFGWDVDFVLDLRKGDSFNLIYEEKFLDGVMIGEGNILAAQFVNQGTTFTAIRYTDAKGNSSYYTPDGNSMRKAFLRSPIDFARISSSFKTRRKHPVLGLTRAHKGTDYAARTGTPIKASGDGKIIWRGTKGGFGRCVIVQHGGNITTLYAHMNNYRKGQRVGTRVKQGQVIGYVGKTGLASGPHLHYEFRVSGVHKNPQTVKLPHASPIQKGERAALFATAEKMMDQLETYKATQLASSSN
ncbi:MAG: peptidoglycan DD-metalloendopeptidase family protein [Amphritea sp.]